MTNGKPITFARLEAVLAELGFQKIVVPGRYVTYEHSPSGTILFVPLHQSKELVPWDVIASARHHLEWRGIMEPSKFEEMLQAVAA